MSKELTPLEALKDIERVCRDSNYVADFYNQRLDIVETALKALEIIKEKIYSVRNDIGMICDKSNIHYQIVINQLTQEEFDLLKEVLK